MRKYLLAGGLSTILLLGACGGEESAGESTDEETVEESTTEDTNNEETETTEDTAEEHTEEESEEETSEEETTEDDSASSGEATRSNPTALGDTVPVDVVTYNDDMEELSGIANVTVDNVIRGQEAVDALTDEFSEPEPAPEGFEWAIFDLTYELTEFDDADHPVLVADDIEIFDESGSNVSQETYAYIESGAFPSGEIYSGGTSEGRVARIVPEGEPFLIKYDDYVDAEAFFRAE